MQKKFQKWGKTVKIGVFIFNKRKYGVSLQIRELHSPATKTAILSYFDIILHFIALWHNDCRIISN